MSKIDDITRDSWIMSTFPEWGTWLVEDIENEVVAPGNVAMWWLGCTGIWMKTPGGANITIDLWCGNGKRTHGDNKMKPGHQMANMCGGRLMQPNLRNVPFVIDPFAFKQVDAVLATHYHQDHMSAEWAASRASPQRSFTGSIPHLLFHTASLRFRKRQTGERPPKALQFSRSTSSAACSCVSSSFGTSTAYISSSGSSAFTSGSIPVPWILLPSGV